MPQAKRSRPNLDYESKSPLMQIKRAPLARLARVNFPVKSSFTSQMRYLNLHSSKSRTIHRRTRLSHLLKVRPSHQIITKTIRKAAYSSPQVLNSAKTLLFTFQQENLIQQGRLGLPDSVSALPRLSDHEIYSRTPHRWLSFLVLNTQTAQWFESSSSLNAYITHSKPITFHYVTALTLPMPLPLVTPRSTISQHPLHAVPSIPRSHSIQPVRKWLLVKTLTQLRQFELVRKVYNLRTIFFRSLFRSRLNPSTQPRLFFDRYPKTRSADLNRVGIWRTLKSKRAMRWQKIKLLSAKKSNSLDLDLYATSTTPKLSPIRLTVRPTKARALNLLKHTPIVNRHPLTRFSLRPVYARPERRLSLTREARRLKRKLASRMRYLRFLYRRFRRYLYRRRKFFKRKKRRQALLKRFMRNSTATHIIRKLRRAQRRFPWLRRNQTNTPSLNRLLQLKLTSRPSFTFLYESVWRGKSNVHEASATVRTSIPSRLIENKFGLPFTAADLKRLSLGSITFVSKLFWLSTIISNLSSTSNVRNSIRNQIMVLQNQLHVYQTGLIPHKINTSNLWSAPQPSYVLRRHLRRAFDDGALLAVRVSNWYYRSLIRFLEHSTGRRISLNLGPFAEQSLTFAEKAKCQVWNTRVVGFQRRLGHRIVVSEGLRLIAVAFKLKDPTFLANWLRGMLARMSFWKYKLLFRYLKFLVRHLFFPSFRLFGVRGFKLRLKGKISVAGNARTRTLMIRVGDTSHSKMDNRVAYDLSYVNTFTGVLGFKLWFFY